MLTLGFVRVGGWGYLACGATHLTAFTGYVGGSGATFRLNVVNPMTDAGLLAVSRWHRCTSPTAECRV